MRPQILQTLFMNVVSLRCVGSGIQEKLRNLKLDRVVDLVYHMPVGIVDRRAMPPLNAVKENSFITSIVTVEKHIPGYKRAKAPYRVRCSNDSGFLTLTFFNARQDYLDEKLPVGARRVVSGRVEKYSGELQMPHPDYIVGEAELEKVQRVEPVYGLTQGLHLKTLLKIMQEALRTCPDLPEWIESNYIKVNKWQSWKTAISAIHNPESEEDLEKKSRPYSRLAYDELLANQLALAIVRHRFRKKTGRAIEGNGSLRVVLQESLPFKLTKGQKEVLKEIYSDMAKPARMLRLLQGDVGSGKTLVALLSMLNTVECGRQAALMAPTEILARQHHHSIGKIISGAGLSDRVRVEILTGRDKGIAREKKLENLKSGRINILIGTHALFQDDIAFKDMGFVVIDEQHRFGVKQRLSLTEKGQDADILLMTATPIPRTLALTFYGDIEISSLREKPANRQPIDTRAVPAARMEEVISGLVRVVEEGKKAYWICPLVEESDELDLAAAKERYASLRKTFGGKVGLVHGRMKTEERDAAMENFIRGDTQILVATTVIEVGVDVPDATIMVIEHAERFGLSQLHQLRGRVGRGEEKSTCVLLYEKLVSEAARKRIGVMRETNDGFVIAEKDLDLRGAGEVLGTRQSGMPDFRVADITLHRELLLAARDDAKMIMEKDPALKTARGQALKTLLYLFEYDTQIKYLLSG